MMENMLFVNGEILNGEMSEDYGGVTASVNFVRRLNAMPGNEVTVYINSPGGDVFGGAQMYTALKASKKKVRCVIESLAASAASVVAMAADEVVISPTAYMMIHNPWTLAIGDEHEMRHSADTLAELKEGLINAYMLKTGLAHDELVKLLDEETWMSAETAVEKGFADSVLFVSCEEQGAEARIAACANIVKIFAEAMKKPMCGLANAYTAMACTPVPAPPAANDGGIEEPDPDMDAEDNAQREQEEMQKRREAVAQAAAAIASLD